MSEQSISEREYALRIAASRILDRLLDESELTIRSLAKKLNVAPQSLSQWRSAHNPKRGARPQPPTCAAIRALATMLDSPELLKICEDLAVLYYPEIRAGGQMSPAKVKQMMENAHDLIDACRRLQESLEPEAGLPKISG